MFLLFLLVSLSVLLLPDLYIWFAFVRRNVGRGWRIVYWIPTLLALAALSCRLGGLYHAEATRLFFGLLMCIAVPKLIFVLCSLAGRGIGLLVPAAGRVGTAIGAVAAIVVCAACCYGFTRGWKRLVVQETTILSSELPPAFDGYRIVHLSDLHIGTFGGDTAYVRQLVERVNALRPDLILFTGDLVNASTDELDPYVRILSQLRAPDGVCSVLGNHDYCTYRRYDRPDGAARNTAELIRRQGEMGWELLLNEHRTVRRDGDSLFVIGVENDSRPPFPSRGDLPQALSGVPEGAFKILLSHDPSHWRREVLPASDIQLTLSGHTHAMQLKVGRFSPSRWSYPEWGGLYREGDRQLFVSPGLGGTIPFRFGAWPEIDLLVLHRADQSDKKTRI